MHATSLTLRTFPRLAVADGDIIERSVAGHNPTIPYIYWRLSTDVDFGVMKLTVRRYGVSIDVWGWHRSRSLFSGGVCRVRSLGWRSCKACSRPRSLIATSGCSDDPLAGALATAVVSTSTESETAQQNSKADRIRPGLGLPIAGNVAISSGDVTSHCCVV